MVARRQLLDCGFGRHIVDDRLEALRLATMFPGVFGLGHRPRDEWSWLRAALLAGGPGSVLSHDTAAGCWRVRRHVWLIHVTTPTHHRSGHGRLRFHRGRLGEPDLAEVDGLPVTSVGRTIVDLLPTSSQRRIERDLDEAFILHSFSPSELPPLTGRRGAPKLRRALARRGYDVRVTDSALERAFLDIVRSTGLPLPETQVQIGPTRVDTYWPALGLVVEIDGPSHLAPGKWELDRRNERALRALGLRVERFTWVEIQSSPDDVAAALLSIAAAQGRT